LNSAPLSHHRASNTDHDCTSERTSRPHLWFDYLFVKVWPTHKAIPHRDIRIKHNTVNKKHHSPMVRRKPATDSLLGLLERKRERMQDKPLITAQERILLLLQVKLNNHQPEEHTVVARNRQDTVSLNSRLNKDMDSPPMVNSKATSNQDTVIKPHNQHNNSNPNMVSLSMTPKGDTNLRHKDIQR